MKVALNVLCSGIWHCNVKVVNALYKYLSYNNYINICFVRYLRFTFDAVK